ncbi:hypothetical protein JCM10207_008348 [Rhodosporidiobolus poonsookiae]
MSDAPPSALSSGVASRFVSSTALEEAKKKREAEWKAAYERIGEAPPPVEESTTYDPRSLYERLQENKSKKQEAFEEQLKFKNHFRALDEEEIDFLDTMIDESNEEEKARKRQIQEEMAQFKAAMHKRAAPAAPPAASPPLASTSASTSSSTTPAPSAPKPATAPKKGKKKTLPGLVMKKKPSSTAASASPPAPAAASPSSAASAAPAPALAAGTKRPAPDADVAAANKGDEAREGDDAAKKRKTADEAEVGVTDRAKGGE